MCLINCFMFIYMFWFGCLFLLHRKKNKKSPKKQFELLAASESVVSGPANNVSLMKI